MKKINITTPIYIIEWKTYSWRWGLDLECEKKVWDCFNNELMELKEIYDRNN